MNESVKQQTLLIVDDMPPNIKTLAGYLQGEGLRIMTALSGEDALEKARRLKPNLILLDVMMPGIDGFETCKRLKADPILGDIPVIFMTSLTEQKHKVAAFEAGAVDYVTKPLYQEEVLARVRTHLRLHSTAENLQDANTKLRELNATKDKFFSIIAHDLRGPFGPIIGILEVLLDSIDENAGSKIAPEELHELVSLAHHAARRVYNLLENLLQWSQLEQGLMPHTPKPIDLLGLIYDNFALLAEVSESKNIKLMTTVEQTIWVHADINMLETVLRNLISNALKFTPQNGRIVVSARERDQGRNYVEVSVTDTGIGISQENLTKLFSLENHYSTEGTDAEEGNGLGLIICREMVEKNGGEIWVESETGQGTSVRFTVPKQQSQTPLEMAID